MAYKEVHRISKQYGWAEGSPEKIALHTLIGGIMAQLGGGDFASGATAAGVNEAIQNELSKIKDPALHQWASAIVGAAVAEAIGGDGKTGASTAASGTKNNNLAEELAAQHQKNPIGVTEKDTKAIVEANNSNITIPSYAVDALAKIPANHNIAEGEFMMYTFSGSIGITGMGASYLVDSYGNVYKGINISGGVSAPNIDIGVQKGYINSLGNSTESDVIASLTGTSIGVNGSIGIFGSMSINSDLQTTVTTGVSSTPGISAGFSYFELVGKIKKAK